MRTLLLLALTGGLLYFAWSRYGSDQAATQSPDGRSAEGAPREPGKPKASGRFLSADLQAEVEARGGARADEGAEGLVETDGRGTSERATSPEPAKTAPRVGDADRAEEGDSPGLDSPGIGDLAALGDPRLEGELMAHRVGDLQAYLREGGSELSLSRRNLLIAYGLLIRGMPGQAQKYADGLEEAVDVTAEEWELLQAALQGERPRARSASARLRPNPLVLGASMGLLAAEGERLLRQQNWSAAAEAFSELLLAEIDAPWPADRDALAAWSDSLEDAQANHRWSREGEWPSLEVEVRPGDSLVAIRKRVIAANPGLVICTGLVHRANQLGEYLRAGDVLRVPTEEVSVIVDLSARWLFYLHGSEVVAAWPVAIGRPGEETRPGTYTVGDKQVEPSWFPPGRVVPYGDPDNPLGTHWIGLENSPGLGIHGTWEPDTIGEMASDGCVRLRNQAVEQLFEILPKDSPVQIRP